MLLFTGMPVRLSHARTWEMHFTCSLQYTSCLDILERRKGFAIESVHGSTERCVISITWARKEVVYKTAHAYCKGHCPTSTFNLIPTIAEAGIEKMGEVHGAGDSNVAIAMMAEHPDHGARKRKHGIDDSYTAAEAAAQLRSLFLTDTGSSLRSLEGEAQRLRILASTLGLLAKVPETVIKEVGQKNATKAFIAALINLAFGWEGIQDEDHARAEEDLRNQLNFKLSNKTMKGRYVELKCVVFNCAFGPDECYKNFAPVLGK